MTENDEFFGFTIEARLGGLCVVFSHRSPEIHEHPSNFPPDAVWEREIVWESVLSETDLVQRIARLQERGADSSMSQAALAALRSAKADAA